MGSVNVWGMSDNLYASITLYPHASHVDEGGDAPMRWREKHRPTHIGFFVIPLIALPIAETVLGPADLTSFHAGLIRGANLQKNKRKTVSILDLV